MAYRVTITPRARRALGGLSGDIYERISSALRSLSIDPRPAGCRRLAGFPAWRLRIGDYRVVYEINDVDEAVEVTAIGHRRDIYRNLR
jgi:mRNA interferase RelE/StbE